MKLCKPWTCSRRRGLTLIEVVASLALLATLLVSTLLAFGSHVKQIRAAQRRLTAIETADRLLQQWRQTAAAPPAPDEGFVESTGEQTDGFRLGWRTVFLQPVELQRFDARLIRLEVYDPTDGVDPPPLATVDILAPLPMEEPDRVQ